MHRQLVGVGLLLRYKTFDLENKKGILSNAFFYGMQCDYFFFPFSESASPNGLFFAISTNTGAATKMDE